MAKNSFIQIRVSEEEKQIIITQAKEKGFDSVTAYLLYLVRQDNKKMEI